MLCRKYIISVWYFLCIKSSILRKETFIVSKLIHNIQFIHNKISLTFIIFLFLKKIGYAFEAKEKNLLEEYKSKIDKLIKKARKNEKK